MGIYAVWEPDAGETDEDATRLPADDARAAAEAWADLSDYNSAEYHIVGGRQATVMVRDLSTGTTCKWMVHGEAVRHYTATVCRDTAEED